MNKVILLNKGPHGKLSLNDFKIISEEVPDIRETEILFKTLYISTNTYLRGRRNKAKPYTPPFKLNKRMIPGMIAEVIKNRNVDFKKGDVISEILAWKEYQTSRGKYLLKVNGSDAKLSDYLGILGMTDLMTYLGLTEIGRPKKDTTIIVSRAGGAIGMVIGQIGKSLDCNVVDISGSDEKVALIKSRFKFDHTVNYKITTELKKVVKSTSLDGVNICFNNLSAEISAAVLANINKYKRLSVCGEMSVDNKTKVLLDPPLHSLLLNKSATMCGFIIGNFSEKFPAFTKQLTSWLKDAKLTFSRATVEGFNDILQAFFDLFAGKNRIKMIVTV
jgi:hypothetical protein